MEMNTVTFDCKSFAKELPDLVLTPGAMPSLAAAAHLRTCPPCAEEYRSFQDTFAALDRWVAPEPSAYFDQKLGVRLREEQAAPAMSWLERLQTSLTLNTGRTFRPLTAGALALALIVGGGSLYTFYPGAQPAAHAPGASATINDLQILDRNDEAFQQLDQLQQDDDNPNPADTQSAPAALPSS